MQYRKSISELEELIRKGHSDAAVTILETIKLTRVPAEYRLELARIFRRAGLWEQGLSLLSNAVAAQNPSDSILAEYGILLLRLGATDEAELTLGRVNLARAPEALQYQALVDMTKWEFAEAIPKLQKFISSGAEPYSALVARVNLGSCLVESRRFQEAGDVLEATIRDSRTQGYNRLFATSLAYRTQLHILSGDLARAKADIEIGSQVAESGATTDHLLFKKWSLILQSVERRDPEPLEELRAIARRLNAWEDLRLADLFELRIRFDMEKFLHLIFGTPYAGFRQEISRELGHLPDREVFYLGRKSAPRFDVRTGRVGEREILKAGGKIHQLLEILLRDFYHPRRIGALFTELFPGEFFNIESSPKRTHAVIVRARRWFKTAGIPVEIVENQGFFSFKIRGNFSFLVPLNRSPADVLDIYLNQIAVSRLPQKFSASLLRDLLNVSRHTIQRIVQHGIETGRLERSGSGTATKYSFRKI